MLMDYKWSIFGQYWLFPPRCILCGRTFQPPPARDLCPPCEAELPWIHNACAHCGLPLPLAAGGGAVCGHCRRAPPPFDRCIAPFSYRPPIGELVSGLKYGARLAHARLLAELLAEHLARTHSPLPELLLPVPLHPSRVRQRGFNQALEIARVMVKRLSLSLDRGGLRRIRATDAQAGLDKTKRRANVRGAFSVRPALDAGHVAILDDVVTTGHTVSEITRMLKRHGVREVSVWAVARTPDQRSR